MYSIAKSESVFPSTRQNLSHSFPELVAVQTVNEGVDGRREKGERVHDEPHDVSDARRTRSPHEKRHLERSPAQYERASHRYCQLRGFIASKQVPTVQTRRPPVQLLLRAFTAVVRGLNAS